MQLNFKKQFLSINGLVDGVTPLKGDDGEVLMINNTLANILVGDSSSGESAAKMLLWGVELIKTGTLDLDKVDQDKVKNIVLNRPGLSAIIRQQILNVFIDREAELADTKKASSNGVASGKHKASTK